MLSSRQVQTVPCTCSHKDMLCTHTDKCTHCLLQTVARLTADNLVFLMNLKKAEAELAAANEEKLQLRQAAEKQRGPWFDEVRARCQAGTHMQAPGAASGTAPFLFVSCACSVRAHQNNGSVHLRWARHGGPARAGV